MRPIRPQILYRAAGIGAWIDVACSVAGFLMAVKLGAGQGTRIVDGVSLVGNLALIPLPFAFASRDERNGGVTLGIGLGAVLLALGTVLADLAFSGGGPWSVYIDAAATLAFGLWLLLVSRRGALPDAMIRLGRFAGALLLAFALLLIISALAAVFSPVDQATQVEGSDILNVVVLALANAPELVWEVFIGGYLLALADLAHHERAERS